MAILVDENTKVLVQGITGGFGGKHSQLSLDYGTALVAGVTPGKGGQTFDHGDHKIPVFDTVEQAAKESGVRFHISDAHFKERNCTGSCCGLPESWNYSRGQFRLAI